MISFVIPAHNEAALLGDTLRILRASADELGEPFEIIVVDDASTDATAEIARKAGATVETIDRRQIAAARNAGAKLARGEILVFVDADTHVPVKTLHQAMAALRGGAIGGGSRFRFLSGPRWAHVLGQGTVLMMRTLSWAAGCFLYVRRDAFDTAGGFDERLYATEELALSRLLKRRGRMVIVSEPVLTSGRKAHLYTPGEMWRVIWSILTRGRGVLHRRDALHMWYDGRR
jgi:cellulose synthase/poly-beta-1,6-N-acetylglucosamine synthase-like glycosyltransferase